MNPEERTRQMYETAGRIVHAFATQVDDNLPPALRAGSTGLAMQRARDSARAAWNLARQKWAQGKKTEAANLLVAMARSIRGLLDTIEGETRRNAQLRSFWRLSPVATGVRYIRQQGQALDRVLAFGREVAEHAAGSFGIALALLAAGVVAYAFNK